MEISRAKLEALVWRHTHKDYKGRLDDGARSILRGAKGGGSELVTLAAMSDEELRAALPERVRKEKGL